MNNKFCILVLNLPGLVLKSGSRWYNIVKKEKASLRYYPYPWFMGYLTSLLKKNGFRAHLTDAVALEWSEDETKKFIKKFKPTHIVCEPTWTSAGTDAEFLNSLDKNIIKIAVGNYGSLFPEKCLKTGVDYVVIGEYEFSILDFLKNGKLARNFFSRKKKKYAPPDLVTNLDLFPFPERDDTPVRYYNEPSCFGRNLVMVSSRGCRFHCSFCNVWGIYGRQNYRTRSAKNVVDEIEDLQRKYNFDEIYFDDDNMVARKEHIDGICQEIIKRGVKVHFCCMGDARVDDETLELLAQAGCTTYKFGFEHTDREVLKAIPKDIDPDRSIEILRKCHRLGMKSYANLIVGLPKSTWKKDLAMFEQVFAARPDLMQIGIATPYPGTEFYTKATKMGWLKAKDITKFPDDKITVICTGAQGEEDAVFMRIANREHKFIRIKKGDTIIFSSSIVPGNERSVQALKDEFHRQRARVFHYKMMDIHASGHARQEELKQMLQLMKPKFFLPIYGQYSMLVRHAELAEEEGIPKKNIVVAENGQVINLNQKRIFIEREMVPSNHVMVDGLGIGDVGEVVLRDRQNLARDGMFVIVAVVDRTSGKVKGSPDIISRGFVYLRESKELLAQTRKRVIEIVDRTAGSGRAVNWNYVKDEIRNKIGNFLYIKTQRRPMILPVVIEV